jgi:hypothetical protein
MTALREQITANGWMVPVLRPAVKHFWEGCQVVGWQPTSASALPTVLCGAGVWMWPRTEFATRSHEVRF